jgi:hypothetical protein
MQNVGDLNRTLKDKHNKYLKHYKPNDIYWGIGVECEMYLELEKKAHVTAESIG